jgi:hypothetical protein
VPNPNEPAFRDAYELLRFNHLPHSEEGLRKFLPQSPTHMELRSHDFGFTSGLMHALTYVRPLPRASVN